jgi:hypothetical protein
LFDHPFKIGGTGRIDGQHPATGCGRLGGDGSGDRRAADAAFAGDDVQFCRS